MTALESVESQSLIDLARRLVACPHFRWLPGMRVLGDGSICFFVDGCGAIEAIFGDGSSGRRPSAAALPDLSDAGTRGHVLQLVRDAFDDPGMACNRVDAQAPKNRGRWYVRHPANGYRLPADYADSEAEALVAALEAAPPRVAS